MNIPKLRSPVVLVHGLFGFDRLEVAGLTMARYFPGIVECLATPGNRVLVPSLSPTAGIAERARQLKNFLLKNSPGEPVHLVAHSLGGLDSRWMISRLGMADRVLSLTTLGTPHRGTVFADWAIGNFAWALRPTLELMGMPTAAFDDLTVAKCRAFNDEVADAPGVRYFSVAGRHSGSLRHPEWLLPYNIVRQAEGDNDGVVSVASATYGDSLDLWEGDHFSLVNWLHPFGVNRGFGRDPAPRYGQILRRLADLGF